MKVQEIVKVLGDFRLKKSKGQNFLIDRNVVIKMIEALEIKENEKILEIGPGLGSLTEELVNKGAKPLCVEIEGKFCEYLNEKFKGKIKVVKEDFLRLDEEILGFPDKIIGSLPYRGAKKIISKILIHFKDIKRCIFLLQKEVADCIISRNNSKDYGPISVIAHLRCDVKRVKNVRPESFFPVPKVQSSIISMGFKNSIIDGDFYRFLLLIFKQRRKTIKSNLKGIMDVDINKRAEELKPEEIYCLYLNLYKINNCRSKRCSLL